MICSPTKDTCEADTKVWMKHLADNGLKASLHKLQFSSNLCYLFGPHDHSWGGNPSLSNVSKQSKLHQNLKPRNKSWSWVCWVWRHAVWCGLKQQPERWFMAKACWPMIGWLDWWCIQNFWHTNKLSNRTWPLAFLTREDFLFRLVMKQMDTWHLYWCKNMVENKDLWPIFHRSLMLWLQACLDA